MQPCKRKHQRVSTSQPTIILRHEDEYTGKIIDISQSGTGIIANAEVLEGDDVSLRFTLPTSDPRKPLEISGKVMHSNKVRQQYLIGVMFNDMEPAHDFAIRNFVSQHQTMKL